MKRIVNTLGKLDFGKRACVVFALCAATAITSPAQTFTTLTNFDITHGANPYTSLIQATNGELYGTTTGGGASGSGTVFKITTSGKLTTLYSFCAQANCSDGFAPYAGLVQAVNGYFYGVTTFGGASNHGTVFQITAGGKLTTLHSFDGTDGSSPQGGLVQATNRKLYGTTSAGGSSNYGTVFEITTGGQLTTLHNFSFTDGANPTGPLVQTTNGALYGTTLNGGPAGGGTIFRITPAGTLKTLYGFCSQSGCTDGAGPFGGLVQAANGNFYGTTSGGGAGHVSSCTMSGGAGWGTVFEITPGGKLTTLHRFRGTDGGVPYAGLVQATDGNFYGTTVCDGANQDGTVFEITAGGTLTTLHNFDGSGGANPFAGVVQGTDGSLYGTTFAGGADSSCETFYSAVGCGTVFSLSVGLGPFVETQPTLGNVGAAVKILGTDLTGATSVTFNGTAAVFKVVSRYLITTTVPAGATSGKVEVVTPSGTLSSNVPFRVP